MGSNENLFLIPVTDYRKVYSYSSSLARSKSASSSSLGDTSLILRLSNWVCSRILWLYSEYKIKFICMSREVLVSVFLSSLACLVNAN